MKTLHCLLICALAVGAAAASEDYFPERWDWETREPGEVGMDAGKLQEAVDFALANETNQPKDLATVIPIAIAGEPFNDIIGPTKTRESLNGVIIRNGYIVAEFGDTEEIDMTFSVTKSYLTATAGLAWDDGLIAGVHDPVRRYVRDGGFDSGHNRQITWHMLLNQTSEWEGTLWDKPHWADRFDGEKRELEKPGTHYEYNDVRVNRLALALLEVWRQPLPRVLRERIMDPIGASPTWRWHGYENSWVEVAGEKMQSVSGGGHWGGGMFINTRDQARFGLLYLRNGVWNGERLVSEEWIEKSRAPGEINDGYGYMNWYLNTGGERYPSAPESTVTFLGAGTNMIWIDWEHDIVSVVRWIDGGAIDEFMAKVLAAVTD